MEVKGGILSAALGYIGSGLLGLLLGLSGTVCFIAGFRTRVRIDDGKTVFGKVKPLDPVRNTDPDVVDALRQERFEKGLDPYLNTD